MCLKRFFMSVYMIRQALDLLDRFYDSLISVSFTGSEDASRAFDRLDYIERKLQKELKKNEETLLHRREEK